MTKSRGINRPRWLPTREQLEILRREFPTTKTADLAERFGCAPHQVHKRARSMGLSKDEAYLASAGGRLDGVRGMGTRFQKGHVPWSKGRKLPGNAVATTFKPGQRPHNWVPVGAYRVGSGYLQRKMTDTGYSPRDWVMVHRLVWEAAHGPVPAGHAVTFKPGRRTTELAAITLDALELLTKREVMLRNSITNLPPQLAELSRLRGRITREINERTKDAA